ncbi:MAG TPA: trypsin-like peptidase domain-containing protein [Feifaniaceae bacterium]|nr:trypsin-like peptidase domain-containing protein [Feifaniaceae bacterium]
MKSTKKWAALILTLLLMLSLTVTSAAASDNPVADARNGVVRIVFTYTLDGEPSGQMGTGFFVGEEGEPVEYILTNAHVVTVYDEYTGEVLGYADEVEVVFDDYDEDSTMTAKVLKIFTNGVDLAVLRLEAPTTLRQPLKLLNAESVDIMDEVYTLGFPGIADDTSGIVSSNVEDVTITSGSITKESFLEGDVKYLQIDAAISSGNSGGPLVDASGNVIGINTQVADPDAGTGLGYALYIDYAMDYFDTMGYPYTKATDGGEVPVTSDELPAPEPEPVPDAGLAWYVIAAIGVAAAAIVILTVLLLTKNKKKQQADYVAPNPQPQPMPQPSSAPIKGRQITNIGQASSLGGKSFAVQGKVIIGRDPAKCQVVFPAKTPGISSAHCAVQEIAQGVVVTDLGSSYGTFLDNGTKLEPNKPYTVPVGEAFYLASKDNGFRVK